MNIRALWLVLSLAAMPATTGQTAEVSHRVGFLTQGSFTPQSNPGQLADQIIRYLAQDGFAPGADLEIVKRGAGGHPELLPGLVTELVQEKVDLIVTLGYPATAAANRVTAGTVPMVIFNTGDPVKVHLVQSLNKPGGNVTGISDVAGELAPKRLELLKQVAPQLHRVAMLWNAGDLGMTARYEASAEAAAILNITVQPLSVREPNDFDNAFAAMERSMPDGLLIVADPLTALNRQRVFDFAARHHLPAIYESESFVRDGGLMSYGPEMAETAERGASLIGRILRGSKPADLPLEQPTRYHLGINLKAAKALDLAIPPALLATADEVIE
jgi:putative tryptophan/tyrosine transport system substrate-binding protein